MILVYNLVNLILKCLLLINLEFYVIFLMYFYFINMRQFEKMFRYRSIIKHIPPIF